MSVRDLLLAVAVVSLAIVGCRRKAVETAGNREPSMQPPTTQSEMTPTGLGDAYVAHLHAGDDAKNRAEAIVNHLNAETARQNAAAAAAGSEP